MTTNLFLKIVSAMMVNAVLFGVGAITIMSVPSLNENAKYLFPPVIVLSFVATPFIAGFIARRMRVRNWGRRKWREGDPLSGHG